MTFKEINQIKKLTMAVRLLNNGNQCIIQLHINCQPESNCNTIQ